MKIIKQLLFISFALLFISCKKEKAIELENFNFDTKVSTFISDRNKYETYDNYYKIKNLVIGADTIVDGEFIGSEKPIRIEYTRDISSYNDIIARFGEYDFNAINFATTLKGNIMIFNGVASKISLKETEKFVELLNEKYGKATETKGHFIKPFDVYTWQLKDRIIKYSVVTKDESNTMKIELSTSKIPNRTEKEDSHIEAYIFIIKKEYQEEIFGKLKIHGGDFVYLE